MAEFAEVVAEVIEDLVALRDNSEPHLREGIQHAIDGLEEQYF